MNRAGLLACLDPIEEGTHMILSGRSNQEVHRCFAVWNEMKKRGQVKDVTVQSEAGGFHWTVRLERLDGSEVIVTTKAEGGERHGSLEAV